MYRNFANCVTKTCFRSIWNSANKTGFVVLGSHGCAVVRDVIRCTVVNVWLFFNGSIAIPHYRGISGSNQKVKYPASQAHVTVNICPLRTMFVWARLKWLVCTVAHRRYSYWILWYSYPCTIFKIQEYANKYSSLQYEAFTVKTLGLRYVSTLSCGSSSESVCQYSYKM
jgi:hypothetical protein